MEWVLFISLFVCMYVCMYAAAAAGFEVMMTALSITVRFGSVRYLDLVFFGADGGDQGRDDEAEGRKKKERKKGRTFSLTGR